MDCGLENYVNFIHNDDIVWRTFQSTATPIIRPFIWKDLKWDWDREIQCVANLYVSSALLAPVAPTTTPVVALPLLPDASRQREGGGGRQKQQNPHILLFPGEVESRAKCWMRERLDWSGTPGRAQLSSLILSLMFALTNTKPSQPCGFICSSLDFSDKVTPTYHSAALILYYYVLQHTYT